MIPRRRFRSDLDFISRVLDDMAYDFNYFPPQSQSYTFKGQIVDTDKYDIVAKKEYRLELLKLKEEEIEALDRQHEAEESYYKEKRKKLVEQKESFTRELRNKNKE